MNVRKKAIAVLVVLLFCVSAYAQDQVTATVEFVVNTNKVIQNENYVRFTEEIVPAVVERADDIESILLIGSASPEGPKKNNIRLAEIRASKIYSYFQTFVSESKVQVTNDYGLFLEKTGLTEEDYGKLRATYIEIHFKVPEPPVVLVERDTVYLRDTIRCCKVDTVYIKEKPKQIPVLGLKTNILADVFATPNIQTEIYTYLWGLSLEFDYTFPWWHKDYDSYFYYQILNGTVGIRKYFRNNYTGHYVGIYANTAIYDICFWNRDKGWQGEVYGVGLSYGYVFQSKKHSRWKFEPYIRLGWFNTKFDTYHASQPWDEKYYYNWYLRASDFVPRRFNMNYFGPTEIGFNITFDLICVRKY